MTDRYVSLELEMNENRSVVKPKVMKLKQKYKTEYAKSYDCITKSRNQTRATNMHFVLCALLIFRLQMAVAGHYNASLFLPNYLC